MTIYFFTKIEVYFAYIYFALFYLFLHQNWGLFAYMTHGWNEPLFGSKKYLVW